MPFVSDVLPVGKQYDRRRSLNEQQRHLIKRLVKMGGTYRGLARIFKVDRKTIKNIARPDLYQKQLQRYSEEQHWKKYYNRIQHTTSMREHRRYKYQLYQEGKLQKT